MRFLQQLDHHEIMKAVSSHFKVCGEVCGSGGEHLPRAQYCRVGGLGELSTSTVVGLTHTDVLASVLCSLHNMTP